MFGCLQFWFFFAQYTMDDNPIGSLWKPMSFVRKKNAYARGLYYELYYSFPLFTPNLGYYSMFIILQIFFNTQETFLWTDYYLWFVSVLWNDIMNKRSMFLL